jgi:hypothetical protein
MEIELGKVYGAGNTDPLVDLQLVLKPEVLLIVDNLQAIETRLARGDTLELILEFATRHLEKWDSGEVDEGLDLESDMDHAPASE